MGGWGDTQHHQLKYIFRKHRKKKAVVAGFTCVYVQRSHGVYVQRPHGVSLL